MRLDVKGLGKRFGGLLALEGIDVVVEGSEIHAVIGPNGAGKTTLLNVLSGFYASDAGQVLLDGRDIGPLRPHQRAAIGIARTFQTIRLFQQMSVLHNVMAGRHLKRQSGFWNVVLGGGASRREVGAHRDKAAQELAFVGLEHRAGVPAGSLSYGERRLLEIARALATEPQMLLLDEPVAGMNPKEMQTVMELIRSIRGRGISVVLVEHNMNLVMKVSDRVSVLNFGRKIFEGTPQEAQEAPEVIEAYLGRRRA